MYPSKYMYKKCGQVSVSAIFVSPSTKTRLTYSVQYFYLYNVKRNLGESNEMYVKQNVQVLLSSFFSLFWCLLLPLASPLVLPYIRGIHNLCIGSPFPAVNTKQSRVFRSFATSSQRFYTAFILVFNNNNNDKDICLHLKLYIIIYNIIILYNDTRRCICLNCILPDYIQLYIQSINNENLKNLWRL